MVIRNTQGAEGVLKQYEDCLREVHTVPNDVKQVETYRTKLKVNDMIVLCGVRVQYLRRTFSSDCIFAYKRNSNHSLICGLDLVGNSFL